MAARLERRELESRILRALKAPPAAWGDIRGALSALDDGQVGRIAAICEEPKL